MAKGGKREGAGRKPGSKTKKTLEREVALRQLQQGILQELRPLLRSALDSAKGLTVMYQKRKVKGKDNKYHRTGELVRVQDQSRVEELLRGDCTGDDWFYITTKDPNIISIRELFDRAFGKPKESVEVKHTGSKVIILD